MWVLSKALSTSAAAEHTPLPRERPPSTTTAEKSRAEFGAPTPLKSTPLRRKSTFRRSRQPLRARSLQSCRHCTHMRGGSPGATATRTETRSSQRHTAISGRRGGNAQKLQYSPPEGNKKVGQILKDLLLRAVMRRRFFHWQTLNSL